MTTRKTIFCGFLAAILAFTLALAFTACKDDDDDGDDGSKNNPPSVASYPSINLTASIWNNATGSGENWSSGNQIKLSDFTTVKPKADDVLKFKISGNASKQMNNFGIEIFQMQGDNWDTYQWLGSSSQDNLPNPFENNIIECPIWSAPSPNAVFYVGLINALWQKNSEGVYTHNSGQTLPPGTQNGDVMATISNFSISLVVDSTGGTDSGGTDGGGNVGLVWTPVAGNFSALFNHEPRTIDYGNGKFIAGGIYGSMAYSPDGIAWTPVADSKFSTATIPPLDQENVSKIAWGNGRFVAVASHGAMSYSSDGITWVRVADPKFSSGVTYTGISGITYGNDKFVAVGNSGKMSTSPDGITWTAVTNTALTAPLNAIAWGNGKFVAVGYAVSNVGKMAYSTNGTNWTAVADADSPFTSNIQAIAWGNGVFVAVGYGGEIAYSSNGETWTAVSNSPFYYDGDDILEKANADIPPAIAFGNGKFVAVSSSGKTAVSSNGSTWTVVADSVFGGEYWNNSIVAIAYGNNRFVVINLNGRFAYWDSN